MKEILSSGLGFRATKTAFVCDIEAAFCGRSCYHAIVQVELKTIGASGQISLGKQYAGRIVTVEKVAEGVWTIKTAQVIPDDEMWLHTPQARANLDRAVEWSASHSRAESDLSALAKKAGRKR
jgi:hypothetical protein